MLIASVARPKRAMLSDRPLALAAGTTVVAYVGACVAYFWRGAR